MKIKRILFMILGLFSLSAYSQVSKDELFDAVWKYEIDSLAMPTNNASYLYSLRSAFRYSIWWDDVFFVDKTNNGETPIFEYEMWSSLDRRGKVVEMDGFTDKTKKEKVKDLISRWDIPELINLFKMDEDYINYLEYNPTLHVVMVVIRGGEIVSINGIALRGYCGDSKFVRLNEHLIPLL